MRLQETKEMSQDKYDLNKFISKIVFSKLVVNRFILDYHIYHSLENVYMYWEIKWKRSGNISIFYLLEVSWACWFLLRFSLSTLITSFWYSTVAFVEVILIRTAIETCKSFATNYNGRINRTVIKNFLVR